MADFSVYRGYNNPTVPGYAPGPPSDETRAIWDEFRKIQTAVQALNVYQPIEEQSMAGKTSAEVAIPPGFRALDVSVQGAVAATGTSQSVSFQVKMGGSWYTATAATYFDLRQASSGTYSTSGMTDRPAGPVVFFLEDSSGFSMVNARLTMPSVKASAQQARLTSSALTLFSGLWNTLDVDTLILVPADARIEAIRLINVSASPRAWTSGTLNVHGIRA